MRYEMPARVDVSLVGAGDGSERAHVDDFYFDATPFRDWRWS
jgi:hypothetical protein